MVPGVEEIGSTVADYKRAARRRLPRAIFGTLEGGAGNEEAIARNLNALRTTTLTPRMLVDVASIDSSVEMLGQAAELPFILAPTGLSGLYRPSGELLVAEAAGPAIYALSCFSSVSLERVAAAAGGRKWFQIYPFRSRDVMIDLMRRARDSGFEALCLTVDVPVLGIRNRDLRSGIRAERPTLSILMDAALHPRWSLPYVLGCRPKLECLDTYVQQGRQGWLPLKAPELDPSFDWEDAAWVREKWRGPLVIKGIMDPDDAKMAFALGADAIVVSNHGGRQLDAAPSPLSVLPSIRTAVGRRAEVYADGGIEQGADILKYVIAGANACLVGRAYLYGLAADGARGVASVVAILKRELELAMRLSGIPRLRDFRFTDSAFIKKGGHS